MQETHQTAKTQYLSNNNNNIQYAYRRFGNSSGIPLILLMHFRGTMDHWDPLLINTLAATRPVILFDNAGVGQSSGQVADTIKGMADHVTDFLSLLKLREIDLLGFSIGGYVAQMVALNAPPGLIRRLVIAGSGPSAGEGVVSNAVEREQQVGQLAGGPHPDYDNCFYRLFFQPSESSQAAGRAWYKRAHERNESTSGEERSTFVSTDYADGGAGITALVAALQAFQDSANRADGSFDRLGELQIPVFVAQGHDDFMIPTSNSFVLQQKISVARLKVYPDSGHGFLYQFAEEFAGDVGSFLDLP